MISKLTTVLLILALQTNFVFGQKKSEQFFTKSNEFFYKYVTSDKANYKAVKENAIDLANLIDQMASIDLDSLAGNEKKAFFINAYNIAVIQQVVAKYPLKSPLDAKGFFETTKFNVGGKKYTLNAIENDILRKQYKDARMHFALVCGALGCPVIANYAYTPEALDAQLTKQTKIAVNNPKFVYMDGTNVMVSEIFKWYAVDFGNTSKSTIQFINSYRKKDIPLTSNVLNYTYNWKLNEFIGKRNELIISKPTSVSGITPPTTYVKDSTETISTGENLSIEEVVTNVVPFEESLEILDTTVLEEVKTEEMKEPQIIELANPELPSSEVNLQTFNAGSLLARGKIDLTVFNTIYTQTKSNWMGVNYSGTRETFVTSLLQFTIGATKNQRFNFGFDVNFKSSAKSRDSSFKSTFRAFDYKNNDSTRVGISSIGLRAKFLPFKGYNDFSIQTTFYVPTIKNPEGYSNPDGSKVGNLYWSDWNRFISWTQFFYVKTFTKFQFFGEVDLLYRLPTNSKQYTHLDLPVTAIFSYFPISKLTFYGLAQHTSRYPQNYSPATSTDFVIPANYTTLGLGTKYNPISNLTIELLYTKFVRGKNTGLGNTFNLGFKYLIK